MAMLFLTIEWVLLLSATGSSVRFPFATKWTNDSGDRRQWSKQYIRCKAKEMVITELRAFQGQFSFLVLRSISG